MHRAALLIGVALSLAAGCQGESSSVSHRSATQAIRSGSPADAGAVLLIFQDAAGTEQKTCSGTVIAPHVVLTAAHCLHEDVLGEDLTEAWVFVGADVWGPEGEDGDNFYPVVARAIEPSFDLDETIADQGRGAPDLGLVATDIALPIAPAILRRSPLAWDLAGTSVRIVGYGRTDPADLDSTGARREAAVTVTDVIEGTVIVDGEETTGMCEGDSGGPLYLLVGDVEVLAGVASFLDDYDCTKTALYARVDTFVDALVAPFVAEHDAGFALPDEPEDPASSAATSSAVATSPSSSGAGGGGDGAGGAGEDADDAGEDADDAATGEGEEGCAFAAGPADSPGRFALMMAFAMFHAGLRRRRARA